MKAKVRPRTSSSTSMPSMVNPVTQDIPAKIPKMMVIKIANTRFKTKDRVTKNKPETVREIPNNLLLENWANTFGPNEIPNARPKNTAPNKIP